MRRIEARHHISWRDIKAFRNVVVHEYDRVMADTVWQIARKDVPPLLQDLECLFITKHGQQPTPQERDPADDR